MHSAVIGQWDVAIAVTQVQNLVKLAVSVHTDHAEIWHE